MTGLKPSEEIRTPHTFCRRPTQSITVLNLTLAEATEQAYPRCRSTANWCSASGQRAARRPDPQVLPGCQKKMLSSRTVASPTTELHSSSIPHVFRVSLTERSK
jgi:hypothetical protein